MRRYLTRAGGFVLGLALLLVPTMASAVIMKLTPLKEVLEQTDFIFTARIDALDPDKPSMILLVDEELKGKAPGKKMPVLLKGDSEAEKEKHTPQLLKRLAPKLPIVLFVTQRGKTYLAFAYTNGTWFQVKGTQDGDAIRWGFLHCEPYLRRTFKGTTDELKQVVVDGLAGKKAPPEPNAKEEPGLGPEIKDEKKTGRATPGGADGPLFAVVPSVLILGPLAFLAMLFPTVFGGLMLFFRRWFVVLSVACTNSSLILVYDWLWPNSWKELWWGGPLALWITMTLLATLGLLWSWSRNLTAIWQDQGAIAPSRGEHIALWVLSLLGIILVGFCLFTQVPLLSDAVKPWLVLWAGIWVGTIYLVYLAMTWRYRSPGRAFLPPEGVMLTAIVIASAWIGLGTLTTSAAPLPPSEQKIGKKTVTSPNVVWRFKALDPGPIDSSPVIVGDRIYTAGAHSKGFSGYGIVYCLDRATGTELWRFDNDGDMKSVFSTPTVADGLLYIGEGFHQDKDCRLFCLDAATGVKKWEFQTGSHTECSPTVVAGKVYFGAGDDGVYCVDATTGKEVWRYKDIHVDSKPAVVDGLLYAGSGIGDLYKNTAVFCLDAVKGEKRWLIPTEMAVWGAPTVSKGHVFFGLGTGNFYETLKPGGSVMCVETHTGKRVWTYDVAEPVLDSPAVDEKHVYFGSRDGHVYCVERGEGTFVWKRDMGSPVVTAVALARCEACGSGTSSVYALGSLGKVSCLDPGSGEEFWSVNVGFMSQSQAQLFSTPAVVVCRAKGVEQRRLYFGAGLLTTGVTGVVYCLEDELREDE